ncbi:MAG TPA: lysine 2,3-aminomutase [Acidobacteriota bacterium]|nr:lysine 2,3-aminomutase [Acidobacteriota bacterium]
MSSTASSALGKASSVRYRPVTEFNVAKIPQWELMEEEEREAVEVVSKVLPFRTNRYVVDELIDWSNIPGDPMYQLTFPQRGMLEEEDYRLVSRLLRGEAPRAEIDQAVEEIRWKLNPHPAGQLTHNVPTLEDEQVEGLQHKYRETVLYFPGQGQTCHAYCTYCFRWAQFVGMPEIKFESRQVDDLVRYLRAHPEVSDVLVTGGDPLIMKTRLLRRYLEPLLDSGLESLRNIRLGTKAPAYWPQRFVTDKDADDLLRLFEEVVESGRHLSVMGHYSHPAELSTPISRQAIRRIRSTGAEIRMQAPIIRHVNDWPQAWAEMWTEGVRLGMVPYYMFVERDTGAKAYFELPLARAFAVFQEAYSSVSGLARSVRGPSMSAFPGKVRILGIERVQGRKVFVLDLLQGRDPSWVRRPFFAEFDPRASWFDQLEPAFGESFFFEEELQEVAVPA